MNRVPKRFRQKKKKLSVNCLQSNAADELTNFSKTPIGGRSHNILVI